MLHTTTKSNLIAFLQFFFVLFVTYSAQAQIYYHNFGTTAITAHPYTVAPTTLNTHLSGSSWTNNTNAWTSNTGATGQALTVVTSPGTITINLTFNVQNNFQAAITSFNFWRQRSNSGSQDWTMKINGTTVGNGTIPTSGAAIGVTNVSTPITGLTGTVTVQLLLTGATGGNFRLDDFTLNGTVTSSCTSPTVTSHAPASGPANTVVILNGSGFSNAAGVQFNGIPAAYTVVSNTILQATVPANATSGLISVTATDGCEGFTSTPFTVVSSDCNLSSEIYISELYDQKTGSGGMIELYNPTNATVSLNGYILQRYGDITDTVPTTGYILAMTGSIPPNSTYLIAGTSPDPSICACPSFTETIGSGFNGNDKFELLKNGVLIDVVNVPFTAAGFTLIRKPNAVAPAAVYNINDWNNTQHNNTVPNTYCQNLGIHNVTPVPTPSLTQPVSKTICENSTTTFAATLTAPAGFAFQWKVLNASGVWVNVVNDSQYSGATTATLTISQAPLSFHNNQYYCEMTSATCNLKSDAAQLYVLSAPAIATVTTTQPTCTVATGTLTITAPTGTGITYSIDGITFQSGTTFPNLAPGNYTVTVKNAGNCTSVTTPITIIPVPGAPAIPTLTLTPPTCTTPTGSIVVTAPLGTGITYSTDGTNFQPGTTFNTLAPGTYTITVKNAAGCTATSAPVTITATPATPGPVTATTIQPGCTTATGSITVTSPIGTDLTYSLDGTTFQSETTFANLNPGTYTITVKNTSGCTTASTPITINTIPGAPAVPVLTATQPNCTVATGSISVISPTGTGMTYSLDGITFQPGTVFPNLNPGSYTVTVKNAAGCAAVSTAITINAAPIAPAVANTTVIQPSCTVATGSITITTPVGAEFTYSIDGINFQPEATFPNLPAGFYTVTVKNTIGCTSTTSPITITAVPGAPAVPTLTTIQPNCSVATGTITVNAPTGTGLTYSLDGTNFQSGTAFANLTPGTYTVTVKNSSGCTSVAAPVTLATAPDSPAVPTATTIQSNCTVATGSITVSSPTGAGLTYSIDGTNFQSGTTFANLTSGTYTITVKNTSGCTATSTPVTLSPAPGAPAAPTLAVVQPTCSSTSASITVTAPTGNGLTYSIDGTNFQSGTAFANLTPGPYTITIKNTSGCIATATTTVNAIPVTPTIATVSTIQPSCNTTPTGTITVNTPIGAGLTYSINGINFQTGTVFANLNPGTYTITVKNASGCTSTTALITINPVSGAPAVPTVTTSQPSCAVPTGNITVTAPMGNGLTYSIDGINFQSGTTFPNLNPGTYTVTVKNAIGCTTPLSGVTINAAPGTPAVPVATTLQPVCGATTGTITVTAPTGAGITYSINGGNFQSGTTFANLAPGTYTITVKNAAGCTAQSAPITINTPVTAPDPGTITGNDQLCLGTTIQLSNTISNGTWSSSNTAIATVDANGLVTAIAAGTVTIRYTVGTNCQATAVKTIKVNPLPLPVLRDAYLCLDPKTGTISNAVVLNSGLSIAQYSFVWLKDATVLNETGSTITVNETGEYTVIATNRATGCSSLPVKATVGTSSIATATAEVGVDFHNNQTITVHVTGGSGDYTYQLNDGVPQDQPYFTNIDEGEYTITVKDKNGCGLIKLKVVALNYPHYFTPNGDGYHDTWNINSLKAQKATKIYIFDRYGKLITMIRPGGAGWDGNYNGYPLPSTDYWFTLTYQSSDGTEKEFKAHFSLKR